MEQKISQDPPHKRKDVILLKGLFFSLYAKMTFLPKQIIQENQVGFLAPLSHPDE